MKSSTMFNEQDSDSEQELKINTGYANNYNSWRQKEELNKLKTKYGEHIKSIESSAEDSESSSDEDEEGAVLTEQLEKDFYKTLACLKNKDPKIYDDKVKFFNKVDDNSEDNEAKVGKESTKKSQKEKKLFLRDYERRIVLERGGKLSDSEDEDAFHRKKQESRAPTYVEEQRALKESISRVLDDNDEDDDDKDEFLLLKPKSKSEVDETKEEEAYKEWLKGQSTEIDNSEKEALKPLRDFWTDPKLDPKEKFLRDYVLNKKFLDKYEDENNLDYDQIAHDSDENLSEDERNIEKQEEFEHKYNFRFEEPDQEFIKRYPRTLENSLRKKDNRRSQKRAEVRQRKEEEKVRKQEELKQLKALKRKEIADKLAMLKDITGNDDIQFDPVDLEGDFDPAEYDRKMQKIFDEEYYAGPEGNVKPEFPDIDEELGIEGTWDDYRPENEDLGNDQHFTGNTHCEDPEFNMDADYDPTKALQSELIDASRKKKKRRRSKFAEIMAKEKPKFDPKVHSSYRDYIEQYYALDYEDMIDDLPCRFKYRKVVPNDYGLSVEEILMADDQELNKWCSLKKALEHKPEGRELHEVQVYRQKAKNEEYKKKIFKSLYAPETKPEDPETVVNVPNQHEEPAKRKRRKKKKANAEAPLSPPKADVEIEKAKSDGPTAKNCNNVEIENETKKKSRKNKAIAATETISESNNGPENVETPKVSNKKNKKRKAVANDATSLSLQTTEESEAKKIKILKAPAACQENSVVSTKKLKKNKQKRKIQTDGATQNDSMIAGPANTDGMNAEKIMKKKMKKNASGATGSERKFKKPIKKEIDHVALLSSERLKAYGLNPKKFRNKLKYGKQK